jgi:hypothetical protein
VGILFFKKIGEKKIVKQLINFRMLNLEIIKNFESYVTILEYHMNKAYDIIFKDQIMIYSIEATKIDDKHFEEVSKQFITLTLKLLGNTIQQELEYLYGDKETLLFNITEYFNRKYEDDEIRKTSQKNLMENENDEETEENSLPFQI